MHTYRKDTFFESGAGHGPIMCNLMVKTFPAELGLGVTRNDLRESLRPDELKKWIPDGGNFLSAKELLLEGQPAGLLVYDLTQQRLGLTVTMRMSQFVTICRNSVIFIQFMVAEYPDAKEPLDALQQRFLMLFYSIANTFVLNDRYDRGPNW